MANVIVDIKDVNKIYGTNHVVKDLNLQVEEGEFLTLLGSSGCGKTTTLRMIAGFEEPTTGSIQVEGAFGVLKNDYEFQKFLLRGKTKVKLEILLLCMGYNLNKLHAKIQNERIGSHLFKVKSA